MGFINIKYIEPLPARYESVEYKSTDGKKIFNSGDFVKDWYDMMKFILMEEPDESYYVFSSSVDHFIMDGAPFDCAYLHMVEEKPVLKYFDKTNPNWFHDIDGIGGGVEFFVPENTKPTWEELRELCNDKKE